jgi:hypothetical protein
MDPCPDTYGVYLSLKDRGLYADERFIALCSFGPRAPSFWSTSGKIYPVPPVGAADPLSVFNTQTRKRAMEHIVMSTKEPRIAFNDAKKMSDGKGIKFEPNERAKDSRCHVYKGDTRDKLWDCLKQTVGEKGGVDSDDEDMDGHIRRAIAEGKKKQKEELKFTDLDDLF